MATLGTYNSGSANSFIYNRGASAQTTSSFVVPEISVLSLSVSGEIQAFSPIGEII